MKTYIIGLLVMAAVVLAACAPTFVPPVDERATSFEECVAAGHPVMESYPRQCNDGTQTFTEVIDENGTLPGPIGGERDEHNCLVAAGYSYDEDVGACTRSWELDDERRSAAKTAVESIGWEGWTVVDVLFADVCDACYTVELERSGARNTLTVENGEVTAASGGEWACTREYMPVCGAVQVQCVTAPCDPVRTTFSNRCEAVAAGAFGIVDGECVDENVSPEGACLSFDGNWLEEFQECEGMSQEQCEALGGTFDGCASACRNDPDAEICTMQCVIVCGFA